MKAGAGSKAYEARATPGVRANIKTEERRATSFIEAIPYQ
jgi:hypothetical protein